MQIRLISLASALCAAALIHPADAAPKVTKKVTYYSVKATTIDGLRAEMAARGPKGYWGYSDWYVQWSGSCKLSVTISITLPKHARPDTMPADVRRKFDRMLGALRAHEEQHGQHAVLAAQEIESAGCRNGNAILKTYNDADVRFDRRTDHGRRQGVILR